MLFTAKYVIPITSDYIEDGAVLIRGNKIEDVGTALDLRAKYPTEEVRDLGLSALMPGFVDVHTHLAYTVMRGLYDDLPYAEWKRELLRREPYLSLEDWENSARLGTLEAIASGITTIADITRTGSACKAADEVGLRARVYREVMTTKKGRAAAVVEEGATDIKKWQEEVRSDRISFGIGPGPIYSCHPEVFKEIAAFARKENMPVAMHLAGSYEEANFIRYGSSPFAIHASEADNHRLSQAYPPWLPAGVSSVQYVANWGMFDVPNIMAVHCVHVDDRDVDTLKKYDVAVAYCPRINAKLGMGSAPLYDFKRAGMRVGLGTDSPAAVDTTDIIDEMRTGLMITRATSPDHRIHVTSQQMLRMATIDGARVLGLEDEIGSLEAGKKADIIAIDLHNSHQNPTANPESAVIYTANQDNVKFSMVDGVILYDNFHHVSGVDRDGIVQTAREIRKRLREESANTKLHDELVEKLSTDRQDRYNR